MGFIRLKGVKGKVFVPEADPRSVKKHPCKDCFQCAVCADARCRVCRRKEGLSAGADETPQKNSCFARALGCHVPYSR